jgi:uncharacterized membrane protein YkvA (DUF1232 family)
MLRRFYSKIMGHPRYRWVVIIASLAYLISPLDFSPDVIPILGWVDDGVVATLLATEITQILLNRRQTMRDKKAMEESQTDTVDVAPLPGEE